MSSETILDGGIFRLLAWIERGYATQAAAEKSGRHIRASWDVSRSRGYFSVKPNGDLGLTENGKGWLADRRFGK